MPASFLFYDLETFGADPRTTRIAQFAALRTDAELNAIEAPISFYLQPADDLLPSPGATMFITKEAFNPLMGDDNKLFSKGINERFAHEIAHQYWGHVVKMGSIEEQWVTESFAEYSSSLVI